MEKLGLTLSGKVKVFAKDFNGRTSYSMSIGQKKEDNTWENMNIQLQFKQGVVIANESIVDIKHSFMTFYTTKNNEQKLKIVVMEFEGKDLKYDKAVEVSDERTSILDSVLTSKEYLKIDLYVIRV
jgi:protease II